MSEKNIHDNDYTDNDQIEELLNASEAFSENLESEKQADTDDKDELKEINEKYLRCYAEFENYKKRAGKEKEDLARFGNESLIYDLLPSIDSLELALKHSENNSNDGVVQGVEMTLKEMHRTLEKYGITKIDAVGKAFDPTIHHAMMNVERDDMDEKMVAEELRPGYLYHDKVLRPSLVAVSVKPTENRETLQSRESNASDEKDHHSDENDHIENIEEE
jgi:molecular chaperone GrpE